MRRPCSILVLALVSGWFVGCGVADPVSTALPYPFHPDDDGGKADDGGGGATSSSAAGPSTSVSSSTSGTSGSTSQSTGQTSNVTTVSTTGPSATTGTGGGAACSPDLDDTECVSCAKDSCCLEVQACADDQDCICWIGCLEDTLGAIDLCIGQCGLPGGALLDLLDCSGDLCDLECDVVGI